MSDIQEYLNRLKFSYRNCAESIDTSTVSSIDTEDLLSESGSEQSSRQFNRSHRKEVRPYKLTENYSKSYFRPKHKRRHQSTTGVNPLKMIQEVDENFEHSRLGYKLEDYLPQKSKLDISAYLPQPYRQIKDSSFLSSIDTLKLLESSQEEIVTRKVKKVPFTPALKINQVVQTSLQSLSSQSANSKISTSQKE